MDTSELKPGDVVLILATVLKRVDDGEGSPPVLYVQVEHAQPHAPSISALVTEDQVRGLFNRPAAPKAAPYPIGTLARTHESQRAAMDEPAP